MSKKTVLLLIVIVGVCILLIGGAGYFAYKKYSQPEVNTLPPLPPPPQTYDFPSEKTQYPADWPNDFKFPEDFVLVGTASGSLPGDTSTGWSARFNYQGSAEDTAKAASEFLESKGWTITDNLPANSDNVTLIVEQDNSSGIIAISKDPNNPSQTLITATFFP